ncbi:NAD-dependent epimerase/dehydratase family protein [Bacillus sp. Marseille-Q1617]|uniref:NAD-dependent epimerase/dehydratase family protein n=1 Tax=Bacillus sp. Marseille-Q1617 TaxID=2736887 RepID=UPI00158CCB8F|nr:NAD-dependent epimerase/dehydratase family protein [Bacillus sp. Marseille-Q1617]
MEKERTAVLAGATGLVGSHLLQLLLKSSQYKKIISFVRTSSGIHHEKLDERVISFDTLKLLPHEEVDDVFCCLGTTIKKAGTKEQFKMVDYNYPLELARVCKQHGAEQYLVISALGASADSRIFYSRVKGEVEQELEKLHYKRLHIFRPSLLVGERKEFRLGEKTGEIISRMIRPVMIGKWRKYRSISADRVAYGMYKTALNFPDGNVNIHESDAIQRL